MIGMVNKRRNRLGEIYDTISEAKRGLEELVDEESLRDNGLKVSQDAISSGEPCGDFDSLESAVFYLDGALNKIVETMD